MDLFTFAEGHAVDYKRLMHQGFAKVETEHNMDLYFRLFENSLNDRSIQLSFAFYLRSQIKLGFLKNIPVEVIFIIGIVSFDFF